MTWAGTAADADADADADDRTWPGIGIGVGANGLPWRDPGSGAAGLSWPGAEFAPRSSGDGGAAMICRAVTSAPSGDKHSRLAHGRH
jgi:hypothetical protein